MPKLTLDTQFRAIILYSVQLLEITTVDKIQRGPASGFVARWLERPSANIGQPRISGVVSNLVDEKVLRICDYKSRTPIYGKGVNFHEELSRVFDDLFDDVDVEIDESNEFILTIDSENIYFPIETLHEAFLELGYYEMQKQLVY